jgi:hypothetical protein
MYDFGALAEKYKQELFDNVVHFGGSNGVNPKSCV